MTISTETCIVTVTGTGAQTIFDYGFLIPQTSGFYLVLADLVTGEQTTLDTSLYSISGLGNAAGGTFTYPLTGDPIPATQTLSLVRHLAYTQTTNFGNQDGYYPAVVDAALDAAAMQTQQLAAGIDRSIRQPVTDTVLLDVLPPAVLRANKTLKFDADGQISLE